MGCCRPRQSPPPARGTTPPSATRPSHATGSTLAPHLLRLSPAAPRQVYHCQVYSMGSVRMECFRYRRHALQRPTMQRLCLGKVVVRPVVWGGIVRSGAEGTNMIEGVLELLPCVCCLHYKSAGGLLIGGLGRIRMACVSMAER